MLKCSIIRLNKWIDQVHNLLITIIKSAQKKQGINKCTEGVNILKSLNPLNPYVQLSKLLSGEAALLKTGSTKEALNACAV